jgi:hypothetical protein
MKKKIFVNFQGFVRLSGGKMIKNHPISITPDGGIMKQLMQSGDPCALPPGYVKGSKAVFHYRVHTIPYQEKQEAGNWFKHGLALARLNQTEEEDPMETDGSCEHVHRCHDGKKECCADGHHEHHQKTIDPNRRTLIGDSRKWDHQPFELRIGRGFSVQAMELAVQTMRIGERARFFCLPRYAEVSHQGYN